MTLYALIPAAGAGSRLRGEMPKQYATLAGRPMLWHAVKSVCEAQIETVFVVLAPDDRQFAKLDWSAFAGKIEPLLARWLVGQRIARALETYYQNARSRVVIVVARHAP